MLQDEFRALVLRVGLFPQTQIDGAVGAVDDSKRSL